MRILLIAPTQSGEYTPKLETFPEIKAIVSNHNTNLLIDVTKQDIYDAVRGSSYDIIHFACHSDDSKLLLNGTEYISKEECSQIARTANARLIFFNGCDSAGLASYAVRHGVELAIFTTTSLVDRIAWQMPNIFYSLLGRSDESIINAYVKADSGDGLYGLLIAPEAIADQRIIRRDVDSLLLVSAKLGKRINYVYYIDVILIIIYIVGVYYGN